MNFWKEKSRDTINASINRMIADGEIPVKGKLSDKQKELFKKRINDAYPFGERKHLPYKMWLEERKIAFYWYGCLPPIKLK